MTPKKERLPSREECLSMFDEFDVPENVRAHSFAVNRVSVFIAQKLKEAGEDIDIDLVDRASLLHDLDKIPTLNNGEHGHLTRKILSEKGHGAVGEIAFKHKFKAILDNGLGTWEEKVVNYADKKCLEDEIVPLKKRFEYGRKRYASFKHPRTKEAELLYIDLEKEIFRIIGLNPEKLGEYVKTK